MGEYGPQYWVDRFAAPVTAEVGLSEKERQGIYNLARRQTQSATNAAAGEMEQKMGGLGFRGGESGIADTALGKVYSGGAEQLGQFGQTTALQEAKDRFAQNMELNKEDTARMGLGSNLSYQMYQGDQQLRAAARAAEASARNAATNLAWAQNRFGQELSFKKEQFGAQQDQQSWENLMNLYGMQGNYEQQVYSPYYNAMGAATTG